MKYALRNHSNVPQCKMPDAIGNDLRQPYRNLFRRYEVETDSAVPGSQNYGDFSLVLTSAAVYIIIILIIYKHIYIS